MEMVKPPGMKLILCTCISTGWRTAALVTLSVKSDSISLKDISAKSAKYHACFIVHYLGGLELVLLKIMC